MEVKEAIGILHQMECNYNHIRKNDQEFEAIEMAISALKEKLLNPLQSGMDIYYVDFSCGKIKHGVLYIVEYDEGELKDFSVNFDDGAFDVFAGDCYGNTFFRSKDSAKSALMRC